MAFSLKSRYFLGVLVCVHIACTLAQDALHSPLLESRPEPIVVSESHSNKESRVIFFIFISLTIGGLLK